jgi:hypothetical protein
MKNIRLSMIPMSNGAMTVRVGYLQRCCNCQTATVDSIAQLYLPPTLHSLPYNMGSPKRILLECPEVNKAGVAANTPPGVYTFQIRIVLGRAQATG